MPAFTESESRQVDKLLSTEQSNNQLFTDQAFPANKSSLGNNHEDEPMEIFWKRPHELCERPQMFVDGASRGDVTQGLLGDCWFLAACSAVATRPDLINKVIPQGQVLYGDGYNGLVSFRLWRMGEWVTVFVDDRLPVNDQDGLIYASCKDPNEFWLPLLEKAFAKFNGSYSNIVGGLLVESFTTLTGFITESLVIWKWGKNRLFHYLMDEMNNGSLVSCATGTAQHEGLPSNHSYTITGIKRLFPKEGHSIKLIRIRNPYGDSKLIDSQWKTDAFTKNELAGNPCVDGEFWVNLPEFIKLFDETTIASKIPDIDDKYTRHLIVRHSAWKKGVNAGGNHSNPKEFATNPQYLLTVTESDDIGAVCDIMGQKLNVCSVVVELIQEHDRRKYRKLSDIAVNVYKVEQAGTTAERLTAGELSQSVDVESNPNQMSLSSVVRRLALEPGKYVVIPYMSQADEERDFLLRVYCRKPITLKDL